MSVACGFSIGISRKQLKHALTLTALHGFFQTASLLYDLLFAYSSKK
jgi:hypothetical protein